MPHDEGDGQNRIKLLISVCEIRDIGVWRISSGRIIRHIDSDAYLLICPDSQVADFKSASDPRWEIVPESRYAERVDPESIRRLVIGANIGRVHWLFQQFLKIEAVLASGLGSDDVVVIWDADTVPLRGICFSESAGGPLAAYHGRERHEPYFETIEKLLGIHRAAGPSFIAQCMPLRAGWVREMIAEIEVAFSTPFPEAVLRLLPGRSGSEFSEYETLGAWALERRANGIGFKRANRWLRSGRRLLGDNPSRLRLFLVLGGLSWFYDFVAIEKWSRPLDPARIGRAVRRLIGRP